MNADSKAAGRKRDAESLGAPCSEPAPARSALRASAFSLLETIGVLAVLAILAAVLLPALIRQMDKVAGDQESAALKSFGDALQQNIMRTRYIPSDADWALSVAAELGLNVSNVTTNARRQPRFFLIDPTWRIETTLAGQSYQQTNAGSSILPVNPRLLMLSSIGTSLPGGIVNGVAAAADFTNIWNAVDGTVPTTAPAFAGWAGSGDDLKVQRVDLSPLFVRLLLSSSASSGTPSYSIDQTNSTVPITNAYFLQNSVLYLYTASGTLDSEQILTGDSAFIYYLGRWRGSVSGAAFVAGVDIAAVVDQYMAAYPNSRAQNGTNQQTVVVQKMIAYMDRYSDWAAAGFPPTTSPSYIAVSSAKLDMMTAVQQQYQHNGYNPPETPCQ